MKKTGLLVLLIITFQYSFSQLATIKFDYLTVRDDLPERQVQFLKQDSHGYMWIGTQNGLVKYDGYKPKVYRFGIGDQAIPTVRWQVCWKITIKLYGFLQ